MKVLKVLVKLNLSAHPGTQLNICAIMKHLSIHGFHVAIAPRTRWEEALDELCKWVQEVIALINPLIALSLICLLSSDHNWHICAVIEFCHQHFSTINM